MSNGGDICRASFETRSYGPLLRMRVFRSAMNHFLMLRSTRSVRLEARTKKMQRI
jgi:hypothetical protein